MLNSLISIFGFAKVAPKPLPKRPPTTRKMSATKADPVRPGPDVTLREAERRRYEEDQIARAERTIRTIGAAAHIFARSVGQVGERPPAIQVARARQVLGADVTAYFQALVLVGRPVPLIPLSLVGDPGREKGFAKGLRDDLKDDLDLWASVRGLEAKIADLAMRTDKPIPEPIAIPEIVQQRLLERDRLRANRAGGATGRGAMRVEPETVPDPVPAEEPETGSRGIKASEPKDDEETEEAPPPVPEDAAKPVSEDDDDPKGPGKP